jgi:DNA-binding PadR family transcriptional regulator
MKSLVNWALLGLIIQRESYAYELARRFERTYGDALALSSTSHIYTALGVLETRALVEPVPGTRAGRQPRPNYRATARGVASYADWLVGFVREDRRRQALFALGLSALAGDPALLATVLERCEQEWGQKVSADVDAVLQGPAATPILGGLSAEHELTSAAKVSWIRSVRAALADTQVKR